MESKIPQSRRRAAALSNLCLFQKIRNLLLFNITTEELFIFFLPPVTGCSVSSLAAQQKVNPLLIHLKYKEVVQCTLWGVEQMFESTAARCPYC